MRRFIGTHTYSIALIGIVGALLGELVWGHSSSRRRSRTSARRRPSSRCREPLDEAFELQGRVYNIVTLGFLERHLAHGVDLQGTRIRSTPACRPRCVSLQTRKRRYVQHSLVLFAFARASWRACDRGG